MNWKFTERLFTKYWRLPSTLLATKLLYFNSLVLTCCLLLPIYGFTFENASNKTTTKQQDFFQRTFVTFKTQVAKELKEQGIEQAYQLMTIPTNTPIVGIPCYVNGGISAPYTDAFVGVLYDAGMGTNSLGTSLDVYHLATNNQIGSTWGTAWNADDSEFYAASVLKRHVAFGPSGSGAIYRITTEDQIPNNTVTPLINLHNMQKPGGTALINTGNDPHVGLGASSSPNQDQAAYALAGKMGLGDMDISPDNKTLYVMNLQEQELIALDVTNAPTTVTISAVYPINTTTTGITCTDGQIRPWAVGVNDSGEIYVGCVCSGENITTVPATPHYETVGPWPNFTIERIAAKQAAINAAQAKIGGYILKLDTGTGNYSTAISFDLGSERSNTATWALADWLPWSDNYPYTIITDVSSLNPAVVASQIGYDHYPQPIIGDIEFRNNGDLIVSVMDRFGLQTGSQQTVPDGSIQGGAGNIAEDGRPAGDILVFSSTGTNTWNNIGISYGDELSIPENAAALGGLAHQAGTDEFIAVGVDPQGVRSNGLTVMSFNNTQIDNQDLVFHDTGNNPRVANKGLALGDVEIGVANAVPVCDLAVSASSISACAAGTFSFNVTLDWSNAPTTGNLQYSIDGGGYQDLARTNMATTATNEAFQLTGLSCNSVKKVTIRFKDATTCQVETVFVFPPTDPAGYIYCTETGEIITGGTISVTPPSGGSISLLEDGSSGRYSWIATGSPVVQGIYTMSITPPNGYTFSGTPGGRTGDTNNILDPTSGSEDNLGGADPLNIGTDANGTTTHLLDFTANANPFFLAFDLSINDPFVDLNNIPLVGCSIIPTPPTGNCTSFEYIYVNDIGVNITNGTPLDLTHKFRVNASNGNLAEIYGTGGAPNPWLASGVIADPHGVSMDNNGFIYISEFGGVNAGYKKLDCDANIVDADAENISATNHIIVGDFAYSTSGTVVQVHHLCDNVSTLVGYVVLSGANGFIDNWGITYNPNDGLLYATDNYINKVVGAGDIYAIDPSNPLDVNSVWQANATINPIITGLNVPMGITFDNSNNMYFNDNGVLATPSQNASYVYKYSLSGGIWSQTGVVSDIAKDGQGFYNNWGIVYSETSNKLYVTSSEEDCIAVIDANTMTYENASSVPHTPGGYAKGIGIVTEACYTGPATIDTTLCSSSGVVYLRDLINCEVCGGTWNRTAGTGGTYDACGQTFNAAGASANTTFTFTGNNNICGPYNIAVNISITNMTASAVAACNGGTGDIELTHNGTAPFSYNWTGPTAIANTVEDPTSLANGTYNVTITDANGCTAMVQSMVNCIAAPTCNLTSAGVTATCNDNGTGTPSDDYFTVTLNPTGSGIGSTYSVSGDITANNIAYGSAQTVGGNFPISGGDLTITITDDATGACQLVDATITAPSVCSTCNITATGAIATCNDNGTGTPSDDYFTVTLNPTASGNGTTYSVSGDITASNIAYGSAQTVGGNFQISDGDLTITITDDATGACQLVNATITAPSVCSTCNITAIGAISTCNDNGTGTPSDDYFTVTLNPTASGNGTTYSVSGDITASNIAYGSAQTVGGNFQISDGDLTITITDDATGACQLVDATITAPTVCSTCNITATGAISTCNDNNTGTPTDDYFTVTLNPTGSGISSTYSVSGDITANNIAYGSAQTVGGNFQISDGDLTITITDDATGACQLVDATITAPAICSVCNITATGAIATCNDNGTGTPTDDYFTVTLNPTGLGISSTYSVSGDITANNIAYGSAQTVGGNFQISDGDLTITITDDATGACQLVDATITAPAICSVCNITATGAIATCNDNNTGTPTDDYFTVTLNPTGLGISSTYSVSGDITANNIAYGSAQTVGGNFQISDGDLTITITDDATGACQLVDATITAPAICSVPMSIGNLVWEDNDNDGQKDAEEEGIEDVELILFEVGSDGEKNTHDDIEIARDTTDANGHYLFDTLIAATYYVKINSGIPTDMTSSTGTGAAGTGTADYEPSSATNIDIDNVDDGTQMGSMVMSDIIQLVENSEPTDDEDTDPNTNTAIDFGLIRYLSVGNLVWEDTDNDGIAETDEDGIDGITVQLITAGPNNTKGDGDDVILETTMTMNGGQYLFDSLYPGEYYVKLSDVAEDMISSTGEGTPVITGTGTYEVAPDPDATDTNNDDNGTQMSSMVMSELVSLTLSDEPINDGDVDSTSNLTVDFGLVPTLSVGNLVWEDTDNDGEEDPEEPGIEDVEVVIFELGPDGEKGTADDIEIAKDTTDANGNYLFKKLTGGLYYVKINDGIPTNMTSSTGTGADGTQPASYEPFTGTDLNVNSNDDGTQMGSMVMSDTFRLIPHDEPINDDDTDNSTNLTIDFGLIRYLSVGNLVWEDVNNDGQNNNGEKGIDGIEVQLITAGPNGTKGDNDDVVLKTMLTANGGQYLFDSLYAGEYYVKLNSGIPSTMISSTGEGEVKLTGMGTYEPAINPDNNVNNDDDGTQMGTMIMSELVSLTLSDEPTNDGDADSTSNLTVDFGLYQPLSIGNLVWEDEDNDGEKDPNEPVVTDVELILYDLGPDGVKSADDNEIAKDTTDANGHYLFDDLPKGAYYVKINSGLPEGWISSTGAGIDGSQPYTFEPGAMTDNNVDNNDDGTQMGSMIMSEVVHLVPNDEPTNDEDTDNNTNTTIDFGVIPTLTIGNLVWEDVDNDGVSETGETGIDDVEIILIQPGPDGQKGTADDVAIDTILTAGGGKYLFESLAPGEYYVKLNNGIPTGFQSSTGEGISVIKGAGTYEPAADPDNNLNHEDDGTQMTMPDGSIMIMSDLITLHLYDEPTNDEDADEQTNLTVDFGLFELLDLGNLVWEDIDNDGIADAGEPGFTDVEVILFTPGSDGQKGTADDVEIGRDTTDNDGHYLFTDLYPGDYFVKLNSGIPAHYASSTGEGVTLADGTGIYEPATDPDTNINNNDDGTQMGQPDGSLMIMSDVVTLVLYDEPTNDGDTDNTTNISVDFGIIPLVGIGNMVWEDLDNNGLMDAGEPAIGGVETILYKDGGDGQVATTDDIEIGRITTDENGKYFYEDLYPGDYFVKLNDGIPYNMFSSTGEGIEFMEGTGPYETAPDQDVTNSNLDDNGNQMDKMIVSDLVTLELYDEPTNDDDTDENTNTAVDFGLIQKVDLGGEVWLDRNNNGVLDLEESLMEGMVISLFRPGADGQAGTADDIEIEQVTTDAAGNYLFTCLFPNVYFTKVNDVPPHLTSSDGNGFGGYTGQGPIEPAVDPDDNVDGDDNGTQMGPMIISDVIHVIPHREPINDDDTLDYTNTTIDFGLTPLHFPHIDDACNCLGNESTLGAGDGEFEETIIIYSSVPNESWELVKNTGMFTTGSEIVTLGTELEQTREEYGYYVYTMRIRHIDEKGYRAVFSNGASEVTINNYCRYSASCKYEVRTNPDGTPGQPVVSTNQDFIIGVNSTATCDTLILCDDQSNFMDDGLIDGLYIDTTARDDQMSICPQNRWQRLTYTFTEFSTAPGDSLLVYDGKNITDPLIGTFGGNGVSQTGGWISAHCDPDTNSTGCLTFRFITNGDNNKSNGWDGNIACTGRGIALTAPDGLVANLTCKESYKIFEIKPATAMADCGIVQDSQIVRIFNENGRLCLDTCLAGTDIVEDTFAIGNYVIEYKLKSDTTKTAQEIIIVQGASLVCNDEINVPLGANCSIGLTPDDLLENTCDTLTDTIYYFITLKGLDKNGDEVVLATGGGKGGNYPQVTKEMIEDCGGSITAEIEKRYYEDLNLNFCNNGQKSVNCEVKVNLLDQTAPIFTTATTNDTFRLCSVDLTTASLGLPTPTAIDNCDSAKVVFAGVTIVTDGGPCDTTRATLNWTATDACGNVATLEQSVVILRPDAADIIQAPDVLLSCGEDGAADLNNFAKTGKPGIKVGKVVNGVLMPTDTIALDTATYVCGYILQKRDIEVPADCGTKVFRYWNVIDWCDTQNGIVPVDTQVIELRDTLAPEFVATTLPTLTLDLPHDACTLDGTKLTTPTATDNCGAPTVNMAKVFRLENGNKLELPTTEWTVLAVDTFEIIWVAVDDCHIQTKTASITQQIIVEDNTKPAAICTDKINVSLSHSESRLHYREIDGGSNDACGIAKYEVSRDEVNWDSIVTFACQDAHSEVKVYLRVTDTNGNKNTCWSLVNVEDKIAPICTDLPTMTESCASIHDINLSPTDANDDGQMEPSEWVDLTTEQASLLNAKYGNPDCSDNVDCGALVIEQQYQFVEKGCGSGTIKRRFRAIDWDGVGRKSSWSEQTINVETKADWTVTLPVDWSGTCGGTIPTSTVEVVNGACDLMAYEMEEKIFTTTEDACLKVVRTFTIINWCKYEAGGETVTITRVENEHGMVTEAQTITSEGYENVGKLQYIQILKLQDETAPILTIAAVDDCIESETCGATKRFAVSATDCNEAATATLTYNWTISAGDVVLASGTGVEFDYPVATNVAYEVTWTVADNCSNTAKEKRGYQFTDCKKPAPYCLHGVAVELMPDAGMIQIWASDLDLNSTDNCTDKNRLQFRLWHESLGEAPTHIASVLALPENINFNCTYSGTQTVNLYVIDEANNWDFCTSYVDVQDNMGACENTEAEGMALISGTIMDWKAQTVEEVQVGVANSSSMMTQADGQYNFELAMNKEYSIEPAKDDHPLNGVSTFDLVLISKHILGITEMENPYQLIAADVNSSGTITAFDMVQIRQLILNINTEFANSPSWKFVYAGYEFTTKNPMSEAYPQIAKITDLQEDMEMDFVAIKMGDVNGNAQPSSLVTAADRTTGKTFEITTEDKLMEAGETYTVTFSTNQLPTIQGYQFTLGYENLKVENLKSEVVGIENFGLHKMDKGMITTSWNQPLAADNNSQQRANSQLFAIKFTALSDGHLSEQLSLINHPTAIEAYDENGDLMDVQLIFTTSLHDDQFELFQNQPNPFQDKTLIGFYLPGDSEVQLVLRDETGRVLTTIKENRKAGYNSIQFNQEEFANGFIYYQLSTKFGTKAKKMIQIK